MNLNLKLTLYTIINSNLIRDLNVTYKSITFLEENIENLHDLAKHDLIFRHDMKKYFIKEKSINWTLQQLNTSALRKIMLRE